MPGHPVEVCDRDVPKQIVAGSDEIMVSFGAFPIGVRTSQFIWGPFEMILCARAPGRGLRQAAPYIFFAWKAAH